MMNVPPSEANRLDLYTYEAMLWHWNEAHSGGAEAAGDITDPAKTLATLDRINADPRLIH